MAEIIKLFINVNLVELRQRKRKNAVVLKWKNVSAKKTTKVSAVVGNKNLFYLSCSLGRSEATGKKATQS